MSIEYLPPLAPQRASIATLSLAYHALGPSAPAPPSALPIRYDVGKWDCRTIGGGSEPKRARWCTLASLLCGRWVVAPTPRPDGVLSTRDSIRAHYALSADHPDPDVQGIRAAYVSHTRSRQVELARCGWLPIPAPDPEAAYRTFRMYVLRRFPEVVVVVVRNTASSQWAIDDTPPSVGEPLLSSYATHAHRSLRERVTSGMACTDERFTLEFQRLDAAYTYSTPPSLLEESHRHGWIRAHFTRALDGDDVPPQNEVVSHEQTEAVLRALWVQLPSCRRKSRFRRS